MAWLISRALMADFENSHSSPVQVAESSGDTSSDGEQSVPSSETHTPQAYLSPDRMKEFSRLSRSGMTFAPLTDDRGEAVLTWCLAASRARTSAPPARAPASPEPDQVFGQRWRALSVRFAPATSGWRTARCLYAEDLAWSSLTLPRWGSLHGGELWERTTQEPRTSGTGSGCWATPTANQQQAASIPAALNEAKRLHPRGQWSLVTQVVADHVYGNKMWPTPKASAAGPDFAAVKRGKSISLQTVVAMFPTPTVQDASNNAGTSQFQRNSLPLNAVAGGALNPTWVEWLMGWPLGWTDCGASATDRFREWCNAHGRNFRND